MIPLRRSGVCAVKVSLLNRKSSPSQQQLQLASSGKEISFLAAFDPVCFLPLTTCGWYRGAPSFHWAPLRNLVQTGKKCSVVSFPPSCNYNRLHNHLGVTPTCQWHSFLNKSQNFFPRRGISSLWGSTINKFQKIVSKKAESNRLLQNVLCWSWFLNSIFFQNQLLPSEHHLHWTM